MKKSKNSKHYCRRKFKDEQLKKVIALDKEYSQLLFNLKEKEVELPQPIFWCYEFSIAPLDKDSSKDFQSAIEAITPTIRFRNWPFNRGTCMEVRNRQTKNKKFYSELIEKSFDRNQFNQKNFLFQILSATISNIVYDKLSDEAKKYFVWDHYVASWSRVSSYYRLAPNCLAKLKVAKIKKFYTHQKIPNSELESKKEFLRQKLYDNQLYNIYDHHFGLSSGWRKECARMKLKRQLQIINSDMKEAISNFEKNKLEVKENEREEIS